MKWIAIYMMLMLSPILTSADQRLDQLMQKMQKKYDTLEGFKANFIQSYQSQRFSESLSESGIVYLKKGGKMKWQYMKPEQKMFVSDGMFYYYYVPEDKQVIKTPVSPEGNDRSPTLFLAGRGNFLEDFKAEWSDPRPGSHVVKLTPLKAQSDFKSLIVDVDPLSGLILRLLVVDEFDNRTEYSFTQIQENPTFPSNLFTFQPPPGTDVIYQRSEADSQ
jgi:outer membrane lipoprotein carrier protein